MTDETQTKPKHPGGRPPFFKTPEDMEVMINDYFALCEAKEKPANMSSLAYHLGFSSRQTLWDYTKKPEFHDALTRARLKVEADTVDCGMQGRGNANFVMFNLMNNFNGAGHDRWESVKKQEVEHSGTISTEQMTDEQLDAKIRRLTQQLDQ